MATLPSGTAPGIYQALTTANLPVAIPIPTGAIGVAWLRFETSSSDATPVAGRVVFRPSDTSVGTVNQTSTNMAYVDSRVASTFRFGKDYYGTDSKDTAATHMHVASNTANAVVRGAWLFDY